MQKANRIKQIQEKQKKTKSRDKYLLKETFEIMP